MPRFAPTFGASRISAALVAASLSCGAGAVPAQTITLPPDELVVMTGSNAQLNDGIFDAAIVGNVIEDIGNTRRTVLDASIAGNIGLIQVNQDAGVATNQNNTILITIGAGAGNSFQSLDAIGGQLISGNTLVLQGGLRSNEILNSMSNTQGIVQINQNAGTLNHQLNVTMLNIGSFVSSGFAVASDSVLSGVVSNNTFNADDKTPKSDVINNSFAGFRGVAQITQSSGDGNAIANSVAIGITVMNIQ